MSYEFEKVAKDLSDGITEVKQRYSARLEKIESYLDKKEIEAKRQGVVTTTAKGYFAFSPEEKAFSEYLRKGEAMDAFEKKTLILANDAGAGYLAPDQYVAEVIEKLQEYSPVRSVAQVRQTDATSVQIPKQTGVVDANWTSEIGLRVEDANLSWGLETIPTHEMYAFVKVGRQMLEDSRVNLDSWLVGEFGRKFANVEGLSFISGNTTGRPEGLLTNANIGAANSGNGTDLTADGFIDLVYSLPQEYRRGASFLMNRGTIQKVRKLKSANSLEYIWQPSFAAGQPETLLGYPVYEACDLPDVGNAAYPVLFGDFRRGYIIVDRIAMEVQRLSERFAEYSITAFLARRRVGGQVVLADAIKKLRIAT